MESGVPQVVRTNASSDAAFVILVSVSYLALISASFETLTLASVVGLMVLGTMYAMLGVYAYGYVTRHPSRRNLTAYFGGQVIISGWIVTLGHGTGFNALLMLPLAGQAVVLLSNQGVYLACAAILAAYVGAVYQSSGSLSTLWDGLVTFLAGLVFVVVFTRLTVEEERARREIERLARELEQANQHLREFALQSAELAANRERNRLAREIHDGLGHYLTTIFMQIQAGQAVMDHDPIRANAVLDKARSLTQSALAEVRQSVAALRSASSQDRPLPDLIAALLSESQEEHLEATLKIIGAPRSLSPQVEMTCFRTAQEGLNNVRKHSHATRMSIVIDYTSPERVHLEISDNGIGAPTSETLEEHQGFGLLGVRERVHLVGGEISIITHTGNGFILSIEVPG
jgi:signal transduction histidine kinase